MNWKKEIDHLTLGLISLGGMFLHTIHLFRILEWQIGQYPGYSPVKMLIEQGIVTVEDAEWGIVKITPLGEATLPEIRWKEVIEKLAHFPHPDIAFYFIAKLQANQVAMENYSELAPLLQEEISKLQQIYPEAIAMGGYAPVSADWGKIIFESDKGKRLIFIYEDNRYLAGKHMSLDNITLQEGGKTLTFEALMQQRDPNFKMKEYLDQKLKANMSPKLAFQQLIKEHLLGDLV